MIHRDAELRAAQTLLTYGTDQARERDGYAWIAVAPDCTPGRHRAAMALCLEADANYRDAQAAGRELMRAAPAPMMPRPTTPPPPSRPARHELHIERRGYAAEWVCACGWRLELRDQHGTHKMGANQAAIRHAGYGRKFA